MRNLMNLINLKMFTSVAVAVGVAVCLVPQSAQAQRGTWGGTTANTNFLNFDINTRVQDQAQADNNRGYFPGAIQNYTLNNGSVLGGPLREASPLGNLTVSKLTPDANGNFLGLGENNITLARLRDRFIGLNFDNDVLRYDVAFPSLFPGELIFPNNTFTFLLPSNDSNQIKNLSGLTRFNQLQGVVPSFGGLGGGFFTLTQASSQRIPEPTATASLLGVGAFGVASLLKRNKHLKKTV